MSKRFFAAAFFAVSVAFGSWQSALAAPADPIRTAIAAFVKTSNAGDRLAFLKLFTADAAMVDNFPPYRFPAPNGPAKWYDGFGADSTAHGMTDGVIAVKTPTYLRITGAHAWAVVPTVFTYKLKGKPQTETGMLVFTLLKGAGGWKITTMSWAQQSDTGFP